MDLHAFLLVLFLSSLLSGHIKVEGGKELFKNEDTSELKEQLKLLNKPAIKTIKTEYGDTYGCVDFYKQPAFDHPLLKNHTFHPQMKPTSFLERNREQVSSKARESVHMELKGGGCPVGTVPIRRITKEDLIRERNASKHRSFADTSPHIAILRTIRAANKLNGAGAKLSIHNPLVSEVQYSASRFVLKNGNDAIRAGWRVDPALYGDHHTRLFIRLDAGQSHCFNTRCPGFVQTNPNIPLDTVFPKISEPGGPVYDVPLFINRDLSSGNWWLLVGPKNTEVGFWPKRIFTGLADFASFAEWGGQVSGPPGPSPGMGSGHSKFESNTDYDAFLGSIKVVNDKGQIVEVSNTETLTDKPSVYYLKEVEQTQLGHLFLFGGPASSN